MTKSNVLTVENIRKLFKSRYKIVPDNYRGYEVRVRPWWFPFYHQKGGINTFSTLEGARYYAKGPIEKGYVD